MAKKRNIEIVIVLDNVRSMHNMGSIFRTSDAFGVEYFCVQFVPHQQRNS